MHQQLFYFLRGLPRTKELAWQFTKFCFKDLWLYGTITFASLSALSNILFVQEIFDLSCQFYQDEQVPALPKIKSFDNINNLGELEQILLYHKLSTEETTRIVNVIKKSVTPSALVNAAISLNIKNIDQQIYIDNLFVNAKDVGFLIDKDYQLHFTNSDQIKGLKLHNITTLNQLLRHKLLPASLIVECKKFYTHTPIKFTKNNVIHVVYRTPGVQSREYSLLMLAQGHDAQNLHGCVKSDKQLLRLENSKVNEMDSAIVNTQQAFTHPLPGARLTSSFGYRTKPFNGFHAGIDLAAPVGTPIKSANEGIVTTAEYKGKYGNMLIITNGKWSTVYGHLSAFRVKQGDKVKAGEVVALVGNTGRSTGPHLHFEIRQNNKPVNPILHLNGKKTVRNGKKIRSVVKIKKEAIAANNTARGLLANAIIV